MNPILSLSFPPDDVTLDPLCQISVQIENLSQESSLIYKVKTAVSKLNLFNVSHKFGEVKPKSHTNIIVTCKTPNELPVNGVKFSICSKVIQPGENIYWHSEQEYYNEFVLKYDHLKGMMMAQSKDQPLHMLNQMQKSQNVCGLEPKAHMKALSDSNGTVEDAFLSSLDTVSENEQKEEEGSNTEVKGHQGESKKEDEKTGLWSMLFGIGTSTGMFILSIYHFFGNSAVWNWTSSLANGLSTLVEDPDIPTAQLDDPFNLSQFFWILTTAVLFLAVIFGKRRLAFPWLFIMIFSHFTSLTSLREIWNSGSKLVESSSQAEMFYFPFTVCAATILFGAGAIFLIWKEIQ